MEPAKTDSPKLPDMVMCGDHSSFTKGEVAVKEPCKEERKRISLPTSQTKLTASISRIERVLSEHAMSRRIGNVDRAANVGSNTLVQAALGSFRWPPYLLCVWVAVLVLTHALYCLTAMLERALPNLKKLCTYFHSWAEDSWKSEPDINKRLYSTCLVISTGLLYVVYYLARAAYCGALWLVEPLGGEEMEQCVEGRVTNYVDFVASKPACDVRTR